MEHLDIMLSRIQRGTREASLALCAACGERVIEVHDKFWVGEPSDAPRLAVELGWAIAIGESQEIDTITSLHDELQDIVDYYNEEDISILASATAVALRIIQHVRAATEEESSLAAARACISCVDVGERAERIIKETGVRTGLSAGDEEDMWTGSAIKLVESWSGPPQRNMFSSLGPPMPSWWKAYVASPRHI